MNDNHTIQLKPWLFLSAILLFALITGHITEKKVNETPLADKTNSILTEIDKIELDNDGITFIFFYRDSSELCQKMRYNIEQLNPENLQGIHFYAMNVEEQYEYYYKYNISGIPNLLIFNGDVEQKRVMGVVSTDNLNKIAKRIHN